MSKANRLTVRQHFLYFVPFDSMFLPNLFLNENLYDEFIEPQLRAILSASLQENNRQLKRVGWVEF